MFTLGNLDTLPQNGSRLCRRNPGNIGRSIRVEGASGKSALDRKLEIEVQRIEKAQAALRESIEQTKALAAKAETLLNAHKKTIKKAQPDD